MRPAETPNRFWPKGYKYQYRTYIDPKCRHRNLFRPMYILCSYMDPWAVEFPFRPLGLLTLRPIAKRLIYRVWVGGSGSIGSVCRKLLHREPMYAKRKALGPK